MVVSSVTRGYNKFIQSHFRQGIVNILFVFHTPMTKKKSSLPTQYPRHFAFSKVQPCAHSRSVCQSCCGGGVKNCFLTSSEWYLCIARYCFLAIRMLTLSIKILYEILLKQICNAMLGCCLLLSILFKVYNLKLFTILNMQN